MAWNLGLLGAAGITLGTYELLETTILSSNTSSVTFSNLNSTYSSTYQHLQLRITSRDSRSTTGGNNVRVTFNGDTAANYAAHRLRGDGNQVTSSASTSQTSMNLYASTAANDGANIFGVAIMDILDPFETTKNTTVKVLQGYALTDVTSAVELRSGLWNNTGAITSITFVPETTGQFVSGSRFSLYGIRSS